MKKLLSLKTILICIAFTVFLLLVKDNMGVVWNIFGTIINILTPFIIGFFIAYILNFPYKFLYTKVFGKMGTKRKGLLKLKKPLSIFLTYSLLVAILVFLVAIVAPQISVNISSLIENAPSYFKSLVQNISNLITWINETFNTNIDQDNLLLQLVDQLVNLLTNGDITKAGLETAKALLSMASGFSTGILGFIISIYFLAAKEQLCSQLKRLTVAFVPIKYLPKLYEIVDITDTKCGRFLVGDILDAAFIGLLTFIAMSIFQLPYAALIAVLIGITNIIPFFGPFIGAIPSAFILFLVNPWDMLWFIIIVFVIQQLDGNIFKPKIIGNQVGLSSFWVLFSVIVGGALFGLVGFVLGTPIYAVIYTLIGKRVKNSIKSKGKIAQEALDFEVLNYQKIAEEQKKLREEKEASQKDKLKKIIGFVKPEGSSNDNKNDEKDSKKDSSKSSHKD